MNIEAAKVQPQEGTHSIRTLDTDIVPQIKDWPEIKEMNDSPRMIHFVDNETWALSSLAAYYYKGRLYALSATNNAGDHCYLHQNIAPDIAKSIASKEMTCKELLDGLFFTARFIRDRDPRTKLCEKK